MGLRVPVWARQSSSHTASAQSSTQRARRANAALPLRLRITASRSPRSSVVNVILCMPSKMEHTQPISMLQWTSTSALCGRRETRTSAGRSGRRIRPLRSNGCCSARKAPSRRHLGWLGHRFRSTPEESQGQVGVTKHRTHSARHWLGTAHSRRSVCSRGRLTGRSCKPASQVQPRGLPHGLLVPRPTRASCCIPPTAAFFLKAIRKAAHARCGLTPRSS